MKKNKLFILITVLITVMVFSVAAVCNQCSLFPSTDTTTQTESGKKDNMSSANESSTDGKTRESTTATNQVESATESENSQENAQPVIEKLLMSAATEGDIFFDLMDEEIQNEFLQTNIYVGLPQLKISIIASDKNNDTLSFEALEDGSTELEVNVTSATAAEFLWTPVAPCPKAIKVIVSDNNGGKAEHDINMNILSAEEVAERMEEYEEGSGESAAEDSGAAMYESVVSLGANPAISGYIVKDTEIKLASSSSGAPYIMVGDNNSNKQIKGYLSFDIRSLHGKTVLGAWLNFSDFEIVNNPRFADYIDVKVYNYGGSLDMADFAVGGQSIARIPTSSGSYEISGDTLKTELQKYLDASSESYFPVKIGLSSASNNNGVTDVFNIYLSNVSLEIDYSG